MFRELLDEIIPVIDSGLRTLTGIQQESFDDSKFPSSKKLSPSVRSQLKQAAAEEREHLALCRARLNELDANPSVLEPLFFLASAGIGAIAGQLGDQVSLGFVEATEDEVCKHLDRHIAGLNEEDERTKAMLESIRADEAQHRSTAREHGGMVFANPIKSGMALAAKVMTRTTSIL